jgi:hypothetical protein
LAFLYADFSHIFDLLASPRLWGSSKGVFRLILQEVKEKYFDNGLRDLLAEEYVTIGIIMGI